MSECRSMMVCVEPVIVVMENNTTDITAVPCRCKLGNMT